MQKPFLKWAGGKRWLTDHADFQLPRYSGRYIEPFLGGGAMFFSHAPSNAVLSDVNARLIETYQVVRSDWRALVRVLGAHHARHDTEYYYRMRVSKPRTPLGRAAQFIYLNRACWNGLYRVNKRGEFNVPIGTKDWILSDEDNFGALASSLSSAQLSVADFETSIDAATSGDLIFADPPYTVAHNFNGFVKYNDRIFLWEDQVRLRDALRRAKDRGAAAIVTNAAHHSVEELYEGFGRISKVDRHSKISGSSHGRRATLELVISI